MLDGLTLPRAKADNMVLTQPILRLSISIGESPLPITSSVLPPPMSMTRRRSEVLGKV